MQIRFRPSYFPFTEPSAEVDVMGKTVNGWKCWAAGWCIRTCCVTLASTRKFTLVSPSGWGMERLTMFRVTRVTDLRSFFENDLRFLKQFK